MIGIFYSIIFGSDGERKDLSTDTQVMERLQWSFNRGMVGALWGFLVGGTLGLLAAGLISILVDGITFGAGQGLKSILGYGIRSLLVTAPRGIIAFGLIGAIIGIALKSLYRRLVETSLSFNYGIKLSIRNAFVAGTVGLMTLLALIFAGSVMNGIVRVLQLGYAHGMENLDFIGSWLPVQTVNFRSNIIPTALFSALFFMWYGGRDFIQHYILRLLLFVSGDTPLRFQHFLNYCVKKDFLRRVGGGYRFQHKHLRDYFLNDHKTPEDRIV